MAVSSLASLLALVAIPVVLKHVVNVTRSSVGLLESQESIVESKRLLRVHSLDKFMHGNSLFNSLLNNCFLGSSLGGSFLSLSRRNLLFGIRFSFGSLSFS